MIFIEIGQLKNTSSIYDIVEQPVARTEVKINSLGWGGGGRSMGAFAF